MRLVRHLVDLPYGKLAAGSVVTIGAYDGLHLGHEQLLQRDPLYAQLAALQFLDGSADAIARSA